MEEARLEHVPDGVFGPVFTQYVGNVDGAGDVSIAYSTGGDGLSDRVKREHVMTLVELTVGRGSAVDEGLVVAIKDAVIVQGYTEVEKRKLVGAYLVACGASSTGFRAERGSLDGVLFLGEPVEGRSIKEVEYAGNGFARGLIVEEVGVGVGDELYWLSSRGWSVGRELFFGVSVDCLGPIVVHECEAGGIRKLGSDLNSGVPHFGEVAVDSLDAGEVTDTRLSAKAGQGHHVDSDIEATELYGPLSCSNHGLVDPGVFRVEEF